MRTHLRFLLLLLAWVASPALVQAQAPGASFPCDGKLYQTRQAAANSTTTTLYRVDRTTSPYTTVALQDLGVRLNAVGYNQRDNFLYAVTYANNVANTVINLYKIGQGGAQLIGPIRLGTTGTTNIVSTNYAGGAIDKDGIMYISAEGGSNSLYRINLNTITTASPRVSASVIDLPGTTNYTFYDLAINPVNNNIYGTAFEGALYRIAPNTAGTAATVDNISSATPVNGGADPVGTAFFDAAGTLLVASNGSRNGTDAGNFYIVDVTSEANSLWSFITTLPRSAQSDGASCIFPSQKIDVVKSVGPVNRVNATEYTVPYTITVKNTATELGVDAANIQVSDFLFRNATNDNTTNITFGTANLPTATATTRSSIEGLQISDTDPNTVFTLNNAGNTSFNGTTANSGLRAGLLTGAQTLKQGFSITITFTARVRYSAGNVPTTAQLNTAVATSSSSTNPGYRLDAANGIYIPPIDLLAADQSTNGTTLPLLPNGDTPSPTPVNFTASIAGIVFEDVNYGGGDGRSRVGSGGVGVSGVRVELYTSTGAYVRAATTDAEGFYSFDNLTNSNTYTVRVVNSTVQSTRDGGTTAGLLAVQTFANASKVGGNNPAGVDPGQQTAGSLSSAAQSTISIAATVGNPASADFGFNFSTIVNTNPSGQGSLSQFITNSNALQNDNTDLSTSNDLNQVGLPAGTETSIFMIPAAALTNGVAVINQTSLLPAITGANTAIDGRTQKNNIGDTNTDLVGTGGTVGVGPDGVAGTADDAVLTRVEKPEVQIQGTSAIAIGLDVQANSTTLRGLSVLGFGNATNSNNDANVRVGAVNGFLLEGSLLGVEATRNTLVTSAASTGNADNLRFVSSTGTAANPNIVRNNLIGYVNGKGIGVEVGSTGVVIRSNEIRNNGIGTDNLDGIDIEDSAGTTVAGNAILDNFGAGVDSYGSAGNNTITDNTIARNGRANNENAGVRLFGSNNKVSQNNISNNVGAGIAVTNGTNAASTTSNGVNNLISLNSISGNGRVAGSVTGNIGIDLLTTGNDIAKGSAPFATLNENATTKPKGANGLVNFPVIFRASTSSPTGNLEVTGYAPKGSKIEFFISDQTGQVFGQGQTFLFTATEGSAADGTTRTGNYSGLVNGLNQGSETGVDIFVFSVPLTTFASLPAAQQTAFQNALANGTLYLTATATVGNNTSEFSGNAKVLNNVAPLPVTLVAFGAQASALNAELSWKTAQELNNDHFVVERSFDGRGFVAVGEVKGQGSTQSATSYAFTDERVANLTPAGLVYYRLRQVDADGTEALSEVQAVRFPLTARTLIDVYPNPATAIQDAKLDLSGAPAGSYQVTLVDMTGRVLRSFSQNGGTVQQLQLTSLPTGTYLVRVQGNGQSFSHRVIKE